jgi:hypothetical protein
VISLRHPRQDGDKWHTGAVGRLGIDRVIADIEGLCRRTAEVRQSPLQARGMGFVLFDILTPNNDVKVG